MAALLYWLGIRAYVIAVHIAALFNPKAKLFVTGRQGLLNKISTSMAAESRRRIWMHCASLGEFEQGRPVLEKLRKKYPGYAFVVTFFSPSGYEVRKNYSGADYVFYLPIDSTSNTRLFLDAVQPALCLFVKYEFWYFLLREIAKRGTPLLLLSALFRERHPFFKWYGGLHRRMLHRFTHLFVQDDHSKKLIEGLGIEQVSVSGDTRFDRVVEAAGADRESLDIADQFCNGYKILVAGSTWAEDEKLLAEVITKLPEDWRLIIAPHEVHEGHIHEVERIFNNRTVRWSGWNGEIGKQVLIIDQIGLLLCLYGYGNVAWVGGGFGKDGVHNVLEAAVYGVPCLFGPIYEKFREATELIAAGGAISLGQPPALVNQLNLWTSKPEVYQVAAKAAGGYVRSNAGATSIILNYLEAKKLLTSP